MVRGWHYAKLSLSSALRLSFSGMCLKKNQSTPRPSEHPQYFIILVPFSLSFLFVCVFILLPLELCRCLKKNQTTPRPSEHPPVMGEKMSKRLGGIKRLQIQNDIFLSSRPHTGLATAYITGYG